jgi:hypothetical protein
LLEQSRVTDKIRAILTSDTILAIVQQCNHAIGVHRFANEL